MKKRITLLCLALVLSLAGCGGAPRLQARDLMAEIPAPKVPVAAPMTEEAAAAAMDFCVRLFQASGAGEKENVLLSPLSVLLALGMTANGAGGETLTQMEEVFGLPLLALNEFCHAWLSSREEDGPLQAANSLWLRDSGELTVEEDFLEANALWYGADVYEAPFDSATLADINAWVDHHTGGMIPSLLEEIPDSAMVYLINALSFDSRWETVYREDQVHTGTFTREDGQERQVELMHSEESYFLSDGEAQGFLKPYQGGRYAFAALLPPEGMSLADYVASLEGGRLAQVLSGAYIGSSLGMEDLLDMRVLLLPIVLLVLGYGVVSFLVGGLLHRFFGFTLREGMLIATPAGANDMALISGDLDVHSPDVVVLQIVRMVIVISLFPQLIHLLVGLLP